MIRKKVQFALFALTAVFCMSARSKPVEDNQEVAMAKCSREQANPSSLGSERDETRKSCKSCKCKTCGCNGSQGDQSDNESVQVHRKSAAQKAVYGE
jgi:hypothetical protein